MQTQTLDSAIKNFNNSLSRLGREIGEFLNPAVMGALDKLTNLMDMFSGAGFDKVDEARNQAAQAKATVDASAIAVNPNRPKGMPSAVETARGIEKSNIFNRENTRQRKTEGSKTLITLIAQFEEMELRKQMAVSQGIMDYGRIGQSGLN